MGRKVQGLSFARDLCSHIYSCPSFPPWPPSLVDFLSKSVKITNPEELQSRFYLDKLLDCSCHKYLLEAVWRQRIWRERAWSETENSSSSSLTAIAQSVRGAVQAFLYVDYRTAEQGGTAQTERHYSVSAAATLLIFLLVFKIKSLPILLVFFSSFSFFVLLYSPLRSWRQLGSTQDSGLAWLLLSKVCRGANHAGYCVSP